MSEENINLAIRDSTKFPLTARAKLAFHYCNQLDKEWNNKEKCELLDIQTKGIDSIKSHIARRKKEFLCHQNERVKTGYRRQQEIETIILDKHKISLKNEATRKIIADKLLAYNKTQNMKVKRQKDRMMNIIQKIVDDYEWKDNAGIKKGPTWKPRIKKIPEPSIEELEEEIFEEEIEEQEWEELPKEEKKVKKGKDKQKPKEKKSKPKKDKSTKSSEKKSKKSSKDSKKEKKGKGAKEEFIMPVVPITNPREKIKLDEIEKMSDMLDPLHKYDTFIEEENEFYGKKDIVYPINKNFASGPPLLIFEDFENDKEYKQKLHIHNNGSEILHCRYYTIKCLDEFESTCLLVEEVGIQKVLPGRFFPITIYFFPKDLKGLEGELIFITQKPGTAEIKQFSVPFKCQLPTININVTPKNIIFKSLPIWEVQKIANKNYKTIEVQNNMIQDCILIIRKAKNDILDIDDEFTNEIGETKKHNSESSLNNIECLINDCFEQISNIFHFSAYFYSIPPKTSVNIKVFWKNGPFVGALQEIFEFEFIEKNNNVFNVLQSENVLVQSEVTGKFITIDYDYLDYNICVLNSIYQQPFNVYNYGNTPVKIGFQYPSKLKQYFSAYPQTFFLKPYNHETISLRFMPKKEIVSEQMKYFDASTNILHCPIKICILSTKPHEIPPTILTVYAILSEPDDIKLRLTSQDIFESGYPVLNVGQVTTQETITADFEIENISSVTQEFGFFNLPQIITIKPDYGFGVLEPHETKKLELCLSPTIFDLIKDDLSHTSGPLQVSYKISCTTTYKLGGIRKKKAETNKFEPYRKFHLESKFNQEYIENIDEIFADDTNSNSFLNVGNHDEFEVQEVENWIPEEEVEEKNTKNLTLIVKATLIDYWTELSHQYVIFPDTPLGSNTTMDILFSTINNSSVSGCVCGYINKDKSIDFDCHFEVTGGCKDITIEPICGDLKKGQIKHLLLTARPTAEYQNLLETAKICKVQRLASEKTGKKKGKAEKQTKKSEKSSPSLDNISVHNCDYYPAEKEIAKTMRPYTVKTIFTFVVTFPEKFNKANEILYLTAECKVIRPDFVTNLATQYINFGPTAISTRPKNIITLENISRREIHPKISPLSPIGPFICTTHIQNRVEQEHILKIPVTFAPSEEIYYKEYFEIKSGNTTETLTVSGEGIKPEFEFAPKFTVCRIQAKFGKFADCAFQVNNKCRAPLNLYFVKICELKGKIQPKPVIKEEKTLSPKGKDKKKGKNKSDKSSKSSKKGKPKKFSEELTPDEEYSLENFFVPYEAESQFKLMNAKDEAIIVEPMSKQKIKIRFETPKPPQEKKEAKDKNKKDKKSKSSKSSSKSSKSSKGSKKNEKGVKYAAKYNIMLGNIVLVKDIIILAEFQ